MFGKRTQQIFLEGFLIKEGLVCVLFCYFGWKYTSDRNIFWQKYSADTAIE